MSQLEPSCEFSSYPRLRVIGYLADGPECSAQEADMLCIEYPEESPTTWGEVQNIKNIAWGFDQCAKMIFPPEDRVINSGPYTWIQKENGPWLDLSEGAL